MRKINPEPLNKVIEERGFDRSKLRINIGCGGVLFSNCVNVDLEPHPEVKADLYGDVVKGFDFAENETFSEVLLIHVIEHIERRNHDRVFMEIWRILKPNGRLVMAFPDFIEAAKGFIENRFGARWRWYAHCLYGRQSRVGDWHVAPIERQDITDRLISNGFVNVKYFLKEVNAAMVAYKGEKLNHL